MGTACDLVVSYRHRQPNVLADVSLYAESLLLAGLDDVERELVAEGGCCDVGDFKVADVLWSAAD